MEEAKKHELETQIQCRRCTAVAVPGAKFCMRCGAPLDTPPDAASPASQVQEPIVAKSPKQSEPAVLSGLKIVAALGLAHLIAFVDERGAPVGEQVGAFLACLLVPFVCGFLAARRKAHSLQTFSNWFLGCAFVLLFIRLNSWLRSPEHEPTLGI